MFFSFIKYIKNRALLGRDFLFDLVLPKYCLNCEKEGEWLCPTCYSLLDFKKQYCLNCKKENKTGYFCSQCKNKYALDGVLIAGDYDNKILSRLIKQLKYHFAQDIAKILAQFLKDFILHYQKGNEFKMEDFLFIPVPLHKKRENSRGFNQSQKILEEFSKLFDIKIDIKNLIKTKNTKAQAKLNEEERKENMKDAFIWKGSDLKGKKIILIDDVATTGSTLNECALVLKNNGSEMVLGLVIAKG